MGRLNESFETLRARRELALIAYQTAGFPALDESLRCVETMARSGADIVELGVPFSDPMADGPTIQYSSQVALTNGVSLRGIIDRLRGIDVGQPVVLMSYLNPLLAYSGSAEPEALFADLRGAGVAGMIVPDMPVEEADAWALVARRHEAPLVFMLAPTSTDERIRQVAERTDAFIYAVSLMGVTGARRSLGESLPGFLERIRSVTDKPVVVGFGISTPEHIRTVRGLADGVIVGSRLVEAVRDGEDLGGIIRELKEATRTTG